MGNPQVSCLFGQSDIREARGLSGYMHQPTDNLTLVAPEHKDRAYPQGSAYFEVQSINGHEVRYRYGADVDQIHFTSWHSAENFRTAQIPTE